MPPKCVSRAQPSPQLSPLTQPTLSLPSALRCLGHPKLTTSQTELLFISFKLILPLNCSTSNLSAHTTLPSKCIQNLDFFFLPPPLLSFWSKTLSSNYWWTSYQVQNFKSQITLITKTSSLSSPLPTATSEKQVFSILLTFLNGICCHIFKQYAYISPSCLSALDISLLVRRNFF